MDRPGEAADAAHQMCTHRNNAEINNSTTKTKNKHVLICTCYFKPSHQD